MRCGKAPSGNSRFQEGIEDMTEMKLITHQNTLRGEQVTLRPMAESDWPDLLRWNSDPEVLYYSEATMYGRIAWSR
jgi:hypothetical protein